MSALDNGPSDSFERALGELRRGAVLALKHEDGIALLASAETVENERFNELAGLKDGQLVLTDRRAQALKLPVYDNGVCRIALPQDRRLVRALADPALDLSHPMKGPFEVVRGEALSIHPLGIALAKSARLLPAVICVPVLKPAEVEIFEADILLSVLNTPLEMNIFSQANVPLALAKDAQIIGFRPSDGGPDHFAIVVGDPSRHETVLVRAHSECFTGDHLGSLKCDCGPQLRAALAQLDAAGSGVLLYLAQEGRGIGMANKLRAYALQDQGFDTVDANHRLGFEDDERDFRVAALMLQALGFSHVQVLTNNPRKVASFESHGITVEGRVPLAVGRTPQNTDYLDTKSKRSGHLL